MQKVLLFIFLFEWGIAPAFAQAVPPLLVEAPCGWFTKFVIDRNSGAQTASALPQPVRYAWGAKHVIRLDTFAVVTGKLLVTPGLYRVDDGTDAFEFIERKCGPGMIPDGVFRTAMPLPFGLLPWYRE